MIAGLYESHDSIEITSLMVQSSLAETKLGKIKITMYGLVECRMHSRHQFSLVVPSQ